MITYLCYELFLKIFDIDMGYFTVGLQIIILWIQLRILLTLYNRPTPQRRTITPYISDIPAIMFYTGSIEGYRFCVDPTTNRLPDNF